MPIFKSTMKFSGRKHGWTETWWQSVTDTDYQQAMDNLFNLAAKRAELLGEQCVIDGLVVSREDELGEGFLRYVNLPGVVQHPAAEQDVAVLFTARDQLNKKRKHTYLRGVWDEVETKNGLYLRDTAIWKDSMTAFKKTITGTNKGGIWGWWGITAKVKKNLTGYIVGADNRITFTAEAGAFQVGDVGTYRALRMAGINGKSGMNGVYVCKILTETTCVSKFPYRTVPYVLGGTVQDQTKGFIQCWGASDQRTTTRHVGAPLLESHGHRKAIPRN
jgi:hypothetical protein